MYEPAAFDCVVLGATAVHHKVPSTSINARSQTSKGFRLSRHNSLHFIERIVTHRELPYELKAAYKKATLGSWDLPHRLTMIMKLRRRSRNVPRYADPRGARFCNTNPRSRQTRLLTIFPSLPLVMSSRLQCQVAELF